MWIHQELFDPDSVHEVISRKVRTRDGQEHFVQDMKNAENLGYATKFTDQGKLFFLDHTPNLEADEDIVAYTAPRTAGRIKGAPIEIMQDYGLIELENDSLGGQNG